MNSYSNKEIELLISSRFPRVNNAMDNKEDDLLNFNDDFIVSKRYGNSLKHLLDKNPNGVSNKVISQTLKIPEEDVDQLIEDILAKLRTKLDR